MKSFSQTLSIAALGFLAACTMQSMPQGDPNAGNAPPTTTAPPTTPPTTTAPPTTTTPPTAPPTTTAPPPAAGLTGQYKSASCGARKYPRNITFAADGTFVAEDLVSPCPPNAKCVWSGIVNNKGTYTRSGDTITLTLAQPGKGPGSQPFPATLVVDPSGAPAEKDEAGKLCVYTK